ncbi:hypothetical protein ACOSQ2_021703 [Xanthoceras sorbifolium]
MKIGESNKVGKYSLNRCGEADITSIGLKLLSGPKGSDVATDNVMDDGPSFDPFGLGDQEIVDNKLIRYSSAADLEIDSVRGKSPTFGWEHT